MERQFTQDEAQAMYAELQRIKEIEDAKAELWQSGCKVSYIIARENKLNDIRERAIKSAIAALQAIDSDSTPEAGQPESKRYVVHIGVCKSSPSHWWVLDTRSDGLTTGISYAAEADAQAAADRLNAGGV